MIVKDNIIKEKDADYIESVFTNFNFPYYLNSIVFPQDKKDYQMTHIFFDENRIILPKKGITTLTVDFEWLEKGDYYIIIDVADLFTGKTVMSFLESKVI